MGKVFSDITSDQKVKDDVKDLGDFLDNSEQMLKLRHEHFIDEVTSSGVDRKELPVSRFLHKRYQLRVSMQRNADIGGQVTRIIGQFADKKYATAIGSVINSVTSILLGQSSGSIQEEKGYLIVLGQTGAIMRIDYLVYIKDVKAARLQTLAQNFYLCSYTIASVDTKGLTFNDFASAVELCYASLPIQQRKDLIETLLLIYKISNPSPSMLI